MHHVLRETLNGRENYEARKMRLIETRRGVLKRRRDRDKERRYSFYDVVCNQRTEQGSRVDYILETLRKNHSSIPAVDVVDDHFRRLEQRRLVDRANLLHVVSSVSKHDDVVGVVAPKFTDRIGSDVRHVHVALIDKYNCPRHTVVKVKVVGTADDARSFYKMMQTKTGAESLKEVANWFANLRVVVLPARDDSFELRPQSEIIRDFDAQLGRLSFNLSRSKDTMY